MVLNDGRPKVRDARKLDPSRASTDVNARVSRSTTIHYGRGSCTILTICPQAARLWARCKAFASRQVTTGPIWKGTSTPLGTKTQLNFQACAQPVTKDELINYIRHAKRLDTEQAAAMAIAYIDRALPHNGDLTDQSEIDEDFEMVEDDDSFEKRPDDRNATLLDDLINDPSIGSMLTDTYMWRADSDYELVENSRDAGKARKLRKVQKLLAESSNEQTGQVTITRTTLQTIRRRRPKLDNFQRLAIPEEYLPDRNVEPKVHENWTHFYGHNQTPLPNGETSTPTVIPKRKFRKIQRLLYHLNGAQDETSVYIRSVDTLIRSAGLLNPQRIAALERSQDPAAIAYSFIAAQRRRQLTVVSDHQWSRFLVKGEGKLILQNRPDVLTSFEDCLVRASTDLVALSAVACPKGVRDHFSNADDVKDRTKRVCEKMEEYVRIFGGGKTENLVFRKVSASAFIHLSLHRERTHSAVAGGFRPLAVATAYVLCCKYVLDISLGDPRRQRSRPSRCVQCTM